MALILSDSRERKGANPYLPNLIKLNNDEFIHKKGKKSFKEQIFFQEQQISIGDYWILKKEKNKTHPCILIERKTWIDLAASIKDGRANEQFDHMLKYKLEHPECMILYIIEGKLKYSDESKIARIPFKNLDAKVRHILLKGIPIYRSSDEQHTAKIIVNFARDILSNQFDFFSTPLIHSKDIEDKLNDPKNKSIILKALETYRSKEESNDVNDLIAFIKSKKGGNQEEEDEEEESDEGESSEEFEIPNEVTKRIPKSDRYILQTLWSSLPGISTLSAPVLMEKYSISDIILYKEREITKQELKEELMDLRYPKGNKFGEKLATKIMKLRKNDDLSIKFISNLPGFSKTTAQVIMDSYTLHDLCLGEDISELKQNNRKLGSKRNDMLQKFLHLKLPPS